MNYSNRNINLSHSTQSGDVLHFRKDVQFIWKKNSVKKPSLVAFCP